MELNDLTQEDYNNFNKKRKKLEQNKLKIENNKAREKSLTKGIISISIGFLAILGGIVLTELTRGGIIFYGLVIVGLEQLLKEELIFIYTKR